MRGIPGDVDTVAGRGLQGWARQRDEEVRDGGEAYVVRNHLCNYPLMHPSVLVEAAQLLAGGVAGDQG